MDGTTGETSSKKNRFIELIKLIPVIGNSLAYVIEHWGLIATIFLIIGFVAGWVIVYSGGAPEFLITGYRMTQPSPKKESKPTQINYKVLTTPVPDPFQPYLYWLEQEGNELKQQNIIQEFQMCYLESQLDIKSSANDWVVEPFNWELTTQRDWKINGYGFQLNADGSFQVLETSKNNPASISFSVPKLKKESKLFSIVRISMNQKDSKVTCRDIRSQVAEVK